MKISIIGASGKVGLETTRLLAEQNDFIEHINVILYSPNNAKKITGFLQDLEESLLIRNKSFANNINFLSTSDIHCIQNSDLIIISAGLFATQDEKKQFAARDISGRDIQSIKNLSLISNICKNIKKLSPLSTVIIITNQSDVLSAKARKILNKQPVYGLGCYIDTIRFKNIFIKEAEQEDISLQIHDIQAYILGYHNKYLFLDQNTFKINYSIKNIEQLIAKSIDKTILRGKEISDLQKDTHTPHLNSGSSKLPAAALFNIIKAYTQPNENIQIPLNRLLTLNEKELIGDIPNSSAQLICNIKQRDIIPVSMHFSLNNINKIRTGANFIGQELQKLEKQAFFNTKERSK